GGRRGGGAVRGGAARARGRHRDPPHAHRVYGARLTAAVHIELTEMLRCPEPHGEAFLVLSTGEMRGRMVRSGILGCPICRHEFPIVKGIVDFAGREVRDAGCDPPATAPHPAARIPHPADSETLQALLDLS